MRECEGGVHVEFRGWRMRIRADLAHIGNMAHSEVGSGGAWDEGAREERSLDPLSLCIIKEQVLQFVTNP